ncbi:uncharacterized protein TNCV_4807511 [Trichonephila clavipes]|nr:uncharacterized protein TNCV_4807511 [Trichonephila clavipes]
MGEKNTELGHSPPQTDFFQLRKNQQPATVGNAIKGFKKCRIETHNPLVFSKHDFAAKNTTVYDVVGNEIENNSANPQTLVVENQHINPPKEPEHMANADYDAIKKPVSGFFQTIA